MIFSDRLREQTGDEEREEMKEEQEGDDEGGEGRRASGDGLSVYFLFLLSVISQRPGRETFTLITLKMFDSSTCLLLFTC